MMANTLNIAYTRTAYQYYDGRAFHEIKEEGVPPSDYSQRKKAILKNLNNALNRFYNKTIDDKTVKSSTAILNATFIKKLYRLAQESFYNEQKLYEFLKYSIRSKLKLPKISGEKIEIDSVIKDIDEYCKIVEQELSPYLRRTFTGKSNREKALEFISVLSSEEFQHRIAGHKTVLSFTVFGKQDGEKDKTAARQKGKAILAQAPATLAVVQKRNESKKSMTKRDRQLYNKNLNKLIDFILRDLQQSYSSILSQHDINKIIDALQIDETLAGLIEEQIVAWTESLGEQIKVGQGKKRKIKTAQQLISSIQGSAARSTYEQKLKAFYKNLYRKIIKYLNSQKTTQSPLSIDQDFMGGALQLHDTFSGSVWASEVTFKLYEYDEQNDKFGGRLDFNKDEILMIIVNLIQEILQDMSSSSGIYSNLAKQGAIYFSKNKDKCFANLKKATSGITDQQFPSWIGAFAPQKVSGLIGELVRVMLIDADKFEPIIVGAENTGEGEIPVDVKLVAIGSDGKRYNLGVQIKNYSTANNRITLYPQTKVDVFGDYFYTYLNKMDGRLLRFILANEAFIGDVMGKVIEKESYLSFLDNFIADFMRYKTVDINGEKYKNNFYILNDKIMPSSYIFMKIIQSVLLTVKKGQQKHFFNITKKAIPYLKTDDEKSIEISGYKVQTIDQEQAVYKVVRGKEYDNALPLNLIGPEGEYYPRHVDINASDFVNKVTITFKGIIIDFSSFR